ncbi:MAG: phosphate-starvation-inducible PsiE family protein [Pseudomonadota bacterium]|nr:phosphate-starvation-inducible PsiE family protein [Pseudomonadota bacterium]
MSSEAQERIERIGNNFVDGFHLLTLFIIGAVIVWATTVELLHIVTEGGPSIKDILLLFIYLELGAMVGIYFKTKRLPVRFLLYIAITALTRVLAIDVKTMSDEHMLTISISILVLTLAVLVIRIGSNRFPGESEE